MFRPAAAIEADYNMDRKIWNIFSDMNAMRIALVNKNAQMHDGGYSYETNEICLQYLQAFADANPAQRSMLLHLRQLFANTKDDGYWIVLNELVNEEAIAPGYTALLETGFQGHSIPGCIIKISPDTYKLILADNGNFLVKSSDSSSKSLSIRSLDVPHQHINLVLSLLSEAKTVPKNQARTLLFTNIQELTRTKFEIIIDDVQHVNKHGRCYIDNIFALILFLMMLSQGPDEGRVLYKKFLLFVRQQVLAEYKQHYAGRLDVSTQNVITACEKIIAKKIKSVRSLERSLKFVNDKSLHQQPLFAEPGVQHLKPPPPVKRSGFIAALKDAYQKTFYNLEDTTKSRIDAFLEVPNTRYYHDVTTKRRRYYGKSFYELQRCTYITLGFLLFPIKNLMKLFIEFLPYCIQKAAKIGIKKLTAVISNPESSLAAKIFSGAGIALLGLLYYTAKLTRIAARIITSPHTSAKVGWKIHPALGVASALASMVAISAIVLFSCFAFAPVAAAATSKLGFSALASTLNHFYYTFVMSTINVVMGSIFTGVAAGCAYMSATKPLIKKPAVVKDPISNLVMDHKTLAEFNSDLPGLHTNLPAPTISTTASLLQAMPPATPHQNNNNIQQPAVITMTTPAPVIINAAVIAVDTPTVSSKF